MLSISSFPLTNLPLRPACHTLHFSFNFFAPSVIESFLCRYIYIYTYTYASTENTHILRDHLRRVVKLYRVRELAPFSEHWKHTVPNTFVVTLLVRNFLELLVLGLMFLR